MMTRRFIVATFVILLVAVAAWMWFERGNTETAAVTGKHALPTPVPQVTAPARPDGVISSVVPGTPLVRTTPATPLPLAADSPGAPDLPAVSVEPQSEARTDLENVRFMLRDFRTRMGENPVGSNAEILRAVMGANALGARLGPPAGQSLNAEGELVDRWGTAYFFHQLSKDRMEIRSAGPDQRMWTNDDLVTK